MQDDNLNNRDTDISPKTTENHYLQNQLLIAMPGLDDPYFKKSVTLICQHSEQGCFGLTINKPIPITIEEVLKQLELKPEKESTNENPDPKSKKIKLSKPALRGGPVQPEQGFIIHDSEDQSWANTIPIDETLSITASQDILVDIAAGKGPKNYLLTLGCASWEAGQLEAEILNNSWLNCASDKKIIFNMPFEERWQGAADILGINLSAMSSFSGHD